MQKKVKNKTQRLMPSRQPQLIELIEKDETNPHDGAEGKRPLCWQVEGRDQVGDGS